MIIEIKKFGNEWKIVRNNKFETNATKLFLVQCKEEFHH